MKTSLWAILFSFVLFSGHAQATDSIPIERFARVSQDLYRGADPGPEGVAALKEIGIRTIINLQSNASKIEEEQEQARANGIDFISLPYFPVALKPSPAQLEELATMLKDPRLYPIYVHCTQGKDRTGMAVALYRVEVQGWRPEQAYQEMVRIGFSAWYEPGLECAFRERENADPERYCDWIPTAEF